MKKAKPDQTEQIDDAFAAIAKSQKRKHDKNAQSNPKLAQQRDTIALE